MTPELMKAVVYTGPLQFSLQEVPVPRPVGDQVLIKVSCVGVCGSDGHMHSGAFSLPYPITLGHEVMGTVEMVGDDVRGIEVGERCVVEPVWMCKNCFFCRRGNVVMCERLSGHGVNLPGGFAEYMITHQERVFPIKKLTDEEAVLIEPTSCAIHAMDRITTKVGIEALVIGAGPSGIMLAQLLKINGAAKVIIVAPSGPKVEIAKQLDAADEYIEIDRSRPEIAWQRLQSVFPRGFDVVVEASGSENIVNESINLVRRGGTLVIYSVYSSQSQVHWAPSKIFSDEIQIIGSFAQAYCFPRAVEYIESGKLKVKGIVTDVFKLDEWGKVVEKMNGRNFVKIAVKP